MRAAPARVAVPGKDDSCLPEIATLLAVATAGQTALWDHARAKAEASRRRDQSEAARAEASGVVRAMMEELRPAWEEQRGEAVQCLCRIMVDRASAGYPDATHEEIANIREFFARAGSALFLAPDPVAAMKQFWQGDRRVGRRAGGDDEAGGDLIFQVWRLTDAGKSQEEAFGIIGGSDPTPGRRKAGKGDPAERVKKRHARARKSREARLIGEMMIQDFLHKKHVEAYRRRKSGDAGTKSK